MLAGLTPFEGILQQQIGASTTLKPAVSPVLSLDQCLALMGTATMPAYDTEASSMHVTRLVVQMMCISMGQCVLFRQQACRKVGVASHGIKQENLP